jgi:hypothetical protein
MAASPSDAWRDLRLRALSCAHRIPALVRAVAPGEGRRGQKQQGAPRQPRGGHLRQQYRLHLYDDEVACNRCLLIFYFCF